MCWWCGSANQLLFNMKGFSGKISVTILAVDSQCVKPNFGGKLFTTMITLRFWKY